MIVKIAWKNIWRKPIRSLIVLLSIAIGLWVGLFLYAFDFGALAQRVDSVVGEETGHIQLHHPQFVEKDKALKYQIPESDKVLEELNEIPGLIATERGFINQAVINSPYGNPFVAILGIANNEDSITHFKSKIVEGDYFDENERRTPQVLVGKKLADKIKLKLKSRVIVTHPDGNGGTKRSMFKVAGIISLTNKMKEENTLFIKASALKRIVGAENAHELVIRLEDVSQLDEVTNQLKIKYPHLEVAKWDEIMPEFKIANEMSGKVMGIMITIILVAVGFGIVNTMLMAILERTRELGMLMAIGMNRKKLFSMVMMETFFLTMIGAPLGLLLGYSTIQYFGSKGIDLSAFAESLETYGYETTIYLKAEPWFYGMVCAQVVCLAFLAALYPAKKALELNPVNAIRKI